MLLIALVSRSQKNGSLLGPHTMCAGMERAITAERATGAIPTLNALASATEPMQSWTSILCRHAAKAQRGNTMLDILSQADSSGSPVRRCLTNYRVTRVLRCEKDWSLLGRTLHSSCEFDNCDR
eukprot:6200035-Pleurochrysis_carterae.AAC.3